MYRTIVAGGALLLATFALAPQAAQAGTHVGIGIGVGGGWGPSQYYPDYSDDEGYDDGSYISCGEGRQILRDYGFRRIRPVRCGGEVYRYEAFKRYRLWTVKVSARSGRIIGAWVIGGDDDY